ncbi:MAG: hypothetical protein WBE13_11315 [Candidatus Acidiferrum sp.]
METQTNVTAIERPQLSGIRGWLLLLIIVLCLNAFIHLAEAMKAVDLTSGPSLEAYLAFALAGLAGSAAVLLTRRKTKGVLLAKIFLWAMVGVGALRILELHRVDPQTVGAALWLAYIYRSKRIKNTITDLQQESGEGESGAIAGAKLTQ